jgi:hypothetical protein
MPNLAVDAAHTSQAIDMNGDGKTDVAFNYDAGSGLTLSKGSTEKPFKASYAQDPSAAGMVRALSLGDSVQAAMTASEGELKSSATSTPGTLVNSSLTGQFASVGTHYVGLLLPGPTISDVNQFAWVSFETTDVSSVGSLAGVITGYGVDTSGADIVAGQTVATPEPGSLALLAMGAAGLGVYRRRRAAR